MTESPYHFFDVHVLRTEYVTPSMIRVAFGGEGLARMGSAGRDQRIKVFLPQPGQDAPVMPDTSGGDAASWYTDWLALDPDVRGIMRTYTTRELRRDPDELIVDFAVHGTKPSPTTARPPAGRGPPAPARASAYSPPSRTRTAPTTSGRRRTPTGCC